MAMPVSKAICRGGWQRRRTFVFIASEHADWLYPQQPPRRRRGQDQRRRHADLASLAVVLQQVVAEQRRAVDYANLRQNPISATACEQFRGDRFVARETLQQARPLR